MSDTNITEMRLHFMSVNSTAVICDFSICGVESRVLSWLIVI